MASAFKVDRNIPPPRDSGKGRPAKYPFKDMKRGDSFQVELRQTPFNNLRQLHATLKSCARNAFGKGGFTVRKIDERALRVWRLK